MPLGTRHHPHRVAVGVVVVGLALVLSGCGSTVELAHRASPPPVAAPAAPPEVQQTPVLPASDPTRIRILSLDVDADLIDLGLQPDGTMEVPADGSVAGWYTGAPAPGELGPAVIAAHVDWKGEPGVFFDLSDLQPGDDVEVQRADGTTAVFRVLRVEQHPKDRFPSDAVYGDIDHAGLRLITCGGDFDSDQRSYVDNIVVYAGLVGSA